MEPLGRRMVPFLEDALATARAAMSRWRCRRSGARPEKGVA